MNLAIINIVLIGHWISDFVLQKNKKKTRAKIKNKNVKHIVPHTLLYTSILTCLIIISQFLNIIHSKYYFSIFYFFIITYITHFLTDFYITKINEKHLKKNKRHEYFVTIGIDQFLHYSMLFSTLYILYIC